MTHSAIKELLWEVMEELFENYSSVFPRAVNEFEKVREPIDIDWTMRETSTSHVFKMKVSKNGSGSSGTLG